MVHGTKLLLCVKGGRRARATLVYNSTLTIPGIEHISEMSWEKLSNKSEVER